MRCFDATDAVAYRRQLAMSRSFLFAGHNLNFDFDAIPHHDRARVGHEKPV
jgi:hypothetical protein